MRIPTLAFAAMVLTGVAQAQTTRPVWGAAPQVTVGAILKELVFDCDRRAS